MADKVKSVIVSGAPENDLTYYGKYLKDSYIICADSGYKKCQTLGVKPDVIVGDFDSSEYPSENCEIIKLNTHKDDSDTFHCVCLAVERGFEDITVLGGIGSRFDHTYSNVLSLNYCFEKGVKCRLINSNNHITVESGSFTINQNGYAYFSLFALFEKCEGLTINGAEYELDNFELLPSAQLTQSNSFYGEQVNISIKKGKILLILCND